MAATRATEAALERAGVDRTDLAVVFATPNYQSEYLELLEAVRAVSGVPSPVGCTGMSVLTTEGEFEGQPGVAVLVATSDAIRARPFLVPTASAEASSLGQTIRRLIRPATRRPTAACPPPRPLQCPHCAVDCRGGGRPCHASDRWRGSVGRTRTAREPPVVRPRDRGPRCGRPAPNWRTDPPPRGRSGVPADRAAVPH